MSTRSNWLLKNKVIDILVNQNATIFGGAVRSKLVHDSDARAFYRLNSDTSASKYDDPTYHPELSGRWEVPNDIDVYAHKDDLEKIISTLKEHFTVTMCFMRDPIDYFPHLKIEQGVLEHHKLKLSHKETADKISLFIKENSIHLSSESINILRTACRSVRYGSIIYIDLLVSNVELEPPFGRLDFDVNGLLYDKNGVRLCKELSCESDPIVNLEKINELITKAKNKQAQFLMSDLDMEPMIRYRIDKFKKKGYTLTGVVDLGEYKPATPMISRLSGKTSDRFVVKSVTRHIPTIEDTNENSGEDQLSELRGESSNRFVKKSVKRHVSTPVSKYEDSEED